MSRAARAGVTAACLGLGGWTWLSAQPSSRDDRPRERGPGPAVSVVAGPSLYDLGGTGTGFSAGVRVDVRGPGKLLIEPGLGYLRYTGSTGATISYLLPEISLQFSPSRGAARPYAGAGVGLAEFASGPAAGRGTVHAAAGMRLGLAGRLGLRAEARYRVYDPLGSAGTMLDLQAGGSWRLGRD